MRGIWRKAALAAVLSITGALGGLVAAAPAQAQVAESASVSISGDPGDYLTGGGSYSYSTDNGDYVNAYAGADNALVRIYIRGSDDDWSLEFDAPGLGPLTPGTYDGATRYPSNGTGPGLNLERGWYACDTLTGTFTVDNVVFGPYGYLETFDATFEAHCDGAEPAARGEVHIANPPAPAPLDLGVAVAPDGMVSSISGKAVLHGTVTCTQPTVVTLSGVVDQVVKKVLVRGTFSAQATCTPGTTASWTASATPNGTTPFGKGDAEVSTRATGHDSVYDQDLTVTDTAIVALDKSKS